MLDWLIQQFGLLGLFLASLIANTILPIPFEPLLFLVKATRYNIWIWLVIASLGAWLGESTMYWIARGGRGAITAGLNWILRRFGLKEIDAEEIVSKESNHWVKSWFDDWGFGAVFVGAFTPLPMFLFDIFAGYLGYPYWKFSLACFIGKFLRYMSILLGGLAVAKISGII